MIRCTVESVKVHPETKQHVVNLQEVSGNAILPLWIGPDTAFAIGTSLYGKDKPERPITHDLIVSAFEKLAVRVARVAVTGFVPFEDQTKQGGVFHATLYLTRGSEEFQLDCRPSDAIAVAVRTGAPIDVDDTIFAKSAIKPQS